MKSLYISLFVVLFASATYCHDEYVFTADYHYFAEAGGSFKLHQIPLNWQEARLRCAYEGAMLASPTNSGFTYIIKSIAVKHKVPVYTGIHATVSNGYFHSLDGIPLDDIPVQWLADNPNIRDDTENCLVYHGEGLFEDVDCNKRYHYICYKKLSNDRFMTRCGTTDKKYKMDVRTNRCYKFHWIARSNNVSAAICSAEGGHLAIINSETEAEVLTTIFADDPKWNSTSLIRLGFYNWGDSNFFGTLHGIPLDDIPVQWLAGNPNIRDDTENCLVYHGEGLFEDVDCNKRYHYICYKKHSTDRFMTRCGTTDKKYKMDVRTNRCYKFHWIARSNNVSAAICSAEGGHLAIINSETEAEVLTTIFADDPKWNSTSLIRLGFYNWGDSNFFGTLHGVGNHVLSRLVSSGCKWIDKTEGAYHYSVHDFLVLAFITVSLATVASTTPALAISTDCQTLEEAGYEKWGPGEPSFYYGGKPQRCGGMFRNGLLDDTTCEQNIPFICEKHLPLRKSEIDMRSNE